jgi:small nuclear ribonucleoprotein E
MNRGGGGGGRKVLLPPINFIFKLLQQHSTVQIWLYEQLAIRIEGRIRVSGLGMGRYCAVLIFMQGFDEFMNLVIDDAVEVKQATKTTEESRRSLGKGPNKW